MDSTDRSSSSLRMRQLMAWALGLLIVVVYLTLPDADEHAASTPSNDDPSEELDRLDIRSVTPVDPYPGSSILVTFSGARPATALQVYAGKTRLDLLATRPGEVVARLPRELPSGPLKIRLAAAVGKLDDAKRSDRSKPYIVRVKSPNLRKVFRNLLGGAALVALGIGLLARGVRESTGLSGARAITRATRLRSVSYLFGALTGALAQSTTSAASVLAALASSGVLPLIPAALAFVGAQCGATIAPLLVAGLIEPREGLIAIAIGALWIALGADRRSTALGRLVLGAGFVAFGLQVFRPGLEPFVSDPMLLALADRLRADTVMDVAACALMGTLLVAALQGPAPLIVLILGVVQTTGEWDLTTALSLLSGTGLGAAIAALMTASAGTPARRLARLHLCFGAVSTLFAACTVQLWAAVAELLLGPQAAGFSGAVRAPLNELGAPLALAFGLSQLACALLLSTLARPLSGWVEQKRGSSRQVATERSARTSVPEGARRAELSLVIALQEQALEALGALAQTGSRSHGQRAEHALADARGALEALVERELNEAQIASALGGGDTLGASAFACLQLQHSLEALLRRTERVTEARLVDVDLGQSSGLSSHDDVVLRELHALVADGLSAMRRSLAGLEPPDLDQARDREIRINMLESHARRELRAARRTKELVAQHLHMLQVIDAYEVVGNQVYRLTEAMSDSPQVLSA
jgi:Na+/phosphate symporter